MQASTAESQTAFRHISPSVEARAKVATRGSSGAVMLKNKTIGTNTRGPKLIIVYNSLVQGGAANPLAPWEIFCSNA